MLWGGMTREGTGWGARCQFGSGDVNKASSVVAVMEQSGWRPYRTNWTATYSAQLCFSHLMKGKMPKKKTGGKKIKRPAPLVCVSHCVSPSLFSPLCYQGEGLTSPTLTEGGDAKSSSVSPRSHSRWAWHEKKEKPEPCRKREVYTTPHVGDLHRNIKIQNC